MNINNDLLGESIVNKYKEKLIYRNNYINIYNRLL